MLRLVGLLFLLLGFAALGSDIASAGDGGLRLTALGEWWYWLPAIQRHLSPALWDFAGQPVLEAPLAPLCFLLAGLCYVLSAIRRG